MRRVTAWAPATVANMGPGFDLLGFALEDVGDTLTLTEKKEPGLVIERISGRCELPLNPQKNVITPVINAMIKKTGYAQGLSVVLNKGIPLGSGIGSSSASSAAAALAFNHLLGYPFSPFELVMFAKEGEKFACGVGHLDNVAPSVLGGICLVLPFCSEVISIQTNMQLYASVICPSVCVMTKESRAVLPQHVSLHQSVIQSARIAGFVLALEKGDVALLTSCFEEEVAQPARRHLIPHYDEIRNIAKKLGAIGSGISGSGPSMVALSSTKAQAQEICQQVELIWKQHGIESFSICCKIPCGAGKVLSDEETIL